MPEKSELHTEEIKLGAQIQRVLQSIRTHLKMDIGFVSEFDRGRRWFRYVDGDSPIFTAGDSNPLPESYCSYIVKGKIPRLLQNAIDDPIAIAIEATRTIPVGAHISVPIILFGTTWGTLCCFSYTPNYELGDRELAHMQLGADLIAGLLEAATIARGDYLEIEKSIDKIISDRNIQMVYQPIYRLSDDRVVAFEALARFNLVPIRSPDKWFADAERVGRGIDLEFLAIEEAMAGFLSLPRHTSISLNLSPAAILSDRFAIMFEAMPLEHVILEVTEHSQIECYSTLKSAIRRFRDQGLRLAIDDVGAGHASFRHVLDLAPDLIKLDMSLTRNIDSDVGRQALASAITQFGREMGCEVVAEGVETDNELLTLRRVGVTKVQGFLVSRPLTLKDASTILLTGRLLARRLSPSG